MKTLWFINESPDFEREQWTLLAYLRDAEIDLKDNKLEPFYSDIRRRMRDVECFITTRTVISNLSIEEKDKLSMFNKIPDDEQNCIEVFKIAKFGLDKLQAMQKEYHHVWRNVESSFNLFYIGEKPQVKIDRGVMFIRYAGSHITEVYKFWMEDGKAMLSLIEYSDESYVKIQARLEKIYINETFIIAESIMSFDTMLTAMPFLASTLEKKVMV